jgi:hypothetical protein
MSTTTEKQKLPVPHKLVLDKCLGQKVVDIKVEDGAFTEVVLTNGVRIQVMMKDDKPRLRVEISRESG